MPERPDRQTQVTPELDGASLGAAVHSLFNSSWGKARQWIASGKISLGGAVCTDERQPVRSGERLALNMNARRPATLLDTVERAIVHLDDHLVVVNKPAGMNTVPFDPGERDTLDRLLLRCLSRLERHGRSRSSARGLSLNVVHRIDRETSGLVVFARSWMAKTRLDPQFREHSVHRRYLAIAHGEVQPRTLCSHLLSDRGDGLRGSREKGTRGRSHTPGEGRLCITHLEVLERLREATLVACRLETGRTHQIRVQLSEENHPLVGERVYIRDYEGPELAAPRLMLHATELGLVHPATGKEVHWEQPMPEDMAQVLGRLRQSPLT